VTAGRSKWPDLARALAAAKLAADRDARASIIEEALRSARSDPDAFWDWFLTLGPEERANGTLITAVLWSWRGAAPVPKRAFAPMLRAAIEERDPSFNRKFVEPCVRAYGRRMTVEALLAFLERGTNFEKAGAANALYWTSFGEDDLGDVRHVLRQKLLREFVENEDLDVRRAIIGKLSLKPEDYPEAMHPLVTQAIDIARSSSDRYLRHRVEIQLGSGGPLMALPHREPVDRIECDISRAVVLVLGYGCASWPQHDEAALAREFDPERVADLARQVDALRTEMAAIEIDWASRTLAQGGDDARAEMRARHPELSDEALDALSWAFTFENR